MNFALAQTMVRRPRVLRGGRAPLYWKRDLSRTLQALGSMPRTCDWVTEIANTHPHLLYEPLLGRCLTELTSDGSVQAEKNEASGASSHLSSPHLAANHNKKTVSERVASAKREQISSPAFENRGFKDARHFAIASQLPQRASDSLLRRTAPETSTDIEILIPRTSAVPHSRAGSPPLTLSPQRTRSEWLRLVAGRAAKRWTRDWFFPSTRKFSSPPITANQSERSHAPSTVSTSDDSAASVTQSPASVETNTLSLDNQWLLSINGQQASPQLLAFLAKHTSLPTERDTQEKIRRESFTGTRSESRSLPSAPDLPALENQSTMSGPGLSRPPGRTFDRHHSHAADSDPGLAADSTFNSEEREQRASPSLAQTVLAPALSPLLPPATAGSPVMPVAADTARRMAWRDEVEARETDLSVLAAQVKRILDEEARRHGIDV